MNVSQFDNLDLALDAMAKHRKPGNGCWTLQAGQVDMWDHTRNHWTKSDRFQLTHQEPEPAPVYKKIGQREKALRKRHWANHKRWAAESRSTLGNVHDRNDRRAELYARWLCDRDGIAIPAEVNHVTFDRDWPEGQSTRDSDGKRIAPRVKAVIFAEAQSDRWGNKRADHGYTPLLTVEIPNWDHVPQMTEQHDLVDAREHENRPFARPMIAEGAAAA